MRHLSVCLTVRESTAIYASACASIHEKKILLVSSSDVNCRGTVLLSGASGPSSAVSLLGLSHTGILLARLRETFC